MTLSGIFTRSHGEVPSHCGHVFVLAQTEVPPRPVCVETHILQKLDTTDVDSESRHDRTVNLSRQLVAEFMRLACDIVLAITGLTQFAPSRSPFMINYRVEANEIV